MQIEDLLSDKILRAVFNLTKAQLDCFLQLRATHKSGSCIRNLADSLKSERSIIQKRLKQLMKKKLVKRESVTLNEYKEKCQEDNRDDIYNTNRGYLYIYTPISDDEILQKFNEIMKKWESELQNFLDLTHP